MIDSFDLYLHRQELLHEQMQERTEEEGCFQCYHCDTCDEYPVGYCKQVEVFVYEDEEPCDRWSRR